jgi:RNA polymerase sigma-70 factor (ECF subfamily)
MSELTDIVLATEQKVGALIEESSLGTTGARQLRQRTSLDTADKVVADAESAATSEDRPRMSQANDVATLTETVPNAVGGDRAAVAALLRTIRPLVFRYCLARLGPAMESTGISAEDVAQEVLLAVVRALPDYRYGADSFLPFVFGIAAHKVTDAYRTVARDKSESVNVVPDGEDADAGPEQRALAREQREWASGLLDILPARQREVLVLRIVLGLSAEETAASVGLSSPGAVRVIQHRALTTLRREILRRESAAEVYRM